MKQKKLIALLLSTALLLSGVNVQTSKAADEQKQQTVAVTLHMERECRYCIGSGNCNNNRRR